MDVLVVKLARVGGVAAGTEIARLAAGQGIPVVMSTLFETGVGVAAALHVGAEIGDLRASMAAAMPELDHGLATAGLLEHDLLVAGLVVEDGRMWLPEPVMGGAGGLGIALDEGALRRYTVETVEAVG